MYRAYIGASLRAGEHGAKHNLDCTVGLPIQCKAQAVQQKSRLA